MTALDAKARNVREPLGGKKYTIDYFHPRKRPSGMIVTNDICSV